MPSPADSAPVPSPSRVAPRAARRRAAFALGLGLAAAGMGVGEAARHELGPFRPPDVTLANGARLERRPCDFDPGGWGARASCARLVPSDTAGSLAVVILHAPAWVRDETPVLYLSGGPGQATGLGAGSLARWRAWRDALGHDGDLVLFDQRGTGDSYPRLDCPESERILRRELREARAPRETFPEEAAALLACRDRLARQGIDLRRYTTERSAQDVAELLEALGGRAWNLYGVSYGTRLALRVLAAHPERIRSVIVDSVYPPDVDSFATWPAVLDGALETLLGGCAADARCADAYPALETTLGALLVQARATPLRFKVSDPEAGPALEVALDDHRLVALLFDALYRWERIPELPRRIAAAAGDPQAALGPLVEDFVSALLDPEASDLAYYAVECQDAPARPARAEQLARAAAHPRVERYVRDDWDLDPCRVLALAPAPPARFAPVVSKTPVLLLAGEYDPVTPVAWAKHAAEGLANGQLHVSPGMAHGVLDADACATEVARAFLAEPMRRVALACEDEIDDVRFETPDDRALLDPPAAVEALVVAMEVGELGLGPAPAEAAVSVVEVDEPEPLHLEAERLHLARPARDHALHLRRRPLPALGIGARARAGADQRLGLAHGALGPALHVGQELARGGEGPGAGRLVAHGHDPTPGPRAGP